jgi:hypothetical protein
MKRSIRKFSLISLILLWTNSVLAQNVMTMQDVGGNARDTVLVSVDISNTSTFVAFQLSLSLDNQMTYLTGSVGLTDRSSGDHSISATVIRGNTLRIIAYSSNNFAFSGNSGSVAMFKLILGSVPGTYALNPVDAIIADANSENILTGVNNGQLTLYAPEINLSTNSLAYTRTIVGEHRDLTFTISNNGNSTLSIDSIVASPTSAFNVIAGWRKTVSAFGSQVVTVRFIPPSKGKFTGGVRVYSSDPDAPSLLISATGTGYKVNEFRVNNLSAHSGSDGTLSFRINNQEPFTGFQFDLAMPGSVVYISGSAQLTGRASGHTINASVVSGGKLRVIAYSSNQSAFSGTDGDVAEIGFHVDGTGGAYALLPSNVIITDSNAQNIVSDYYSGQLTIASADIQSIQSVDYGSVSILDTADVTLTIQNVGNDTLHITSLVSNDTRFWAEASLPITIFPADQIILPTHFHSNTAGSFTGKYAIRSNDPDEDPYYISFAGSSFAPNRLSVISSSAQRADSIPVRFGIINVEPFVAFQFDVSLPPEFVFVPSSALLSDRATDHQVIAGLLSNGKVRVISFSLTQSTFRGDSGEVVRFTAMSSVDSGIFPITLSNVIIGDDSNQNIVTGYDNGAVTIAELQGSPYLSLKVYLQGYYDPPADTSRIDTISVELRDKSAPAVRVDTARVVTDKFGKATSSFPKALASADSFYMVVKHRNHLGVISTIPFRFAPNETTFVDLTDSISKVQGTEAMWAESNGKFSLRGGDADGNGVVNAIDRNAYWRVQNGTSGTNLPADFNGDGAVNAIDRNAIWRVNNGRASYVP